VNIKVLESEHGLIKYGEHRDTQYTLKGDFGDNYSLIIPFPKKGCMCLNCHDIFDSKLIFCQPYWEYAVKFPLIYEDILIQWSRASFEEIINQNKLYELIEKGVGVFAWKDKSYALAIKGRIKELMDSEFDVNYILKALSEIFIDYYLQHQDLKKYIGKISLAHEAFDFFSSHKAFGIHVSDVCDRMNIERKTLEITYKKAFGVSPGKHLRQMRLYSIRKNLLESKGKNKVNIGKLLKRNGVYHAGHFGQYYKKSFGQSMSETLD
jgi:AraC-like DNA-binding protein